jgi:NAD(P)-dependent dehydrogenase (short-subunit alcohol dehydrogenase family)
MTLHPARRLCSAVVIGGGSGLGREIALAFAARGCIVFGTATSTEEVEEVRSASSRRVSLAVCDVANADSVRAWAGGVSDALDWAGLDILVSNPSAATAGPLETLSSASVRRTFDVNVYGALTVINAFLPSLRKATGRLIQLSSWTATVPLPFDGVTAASKVAMETLATVYRAELKPFGVDVVIVPLGSLADDPPPPAMAASGKPQQGMTAMHRDLYARRWSACTEPRSEGASAITASEAAKRVVEIAERHPAPERVPVGADAEEMVRAAVGRSDEEMDSFRLKLVGLQ